MEYLVNFEWGIFNSENETPNSINDESRETSIESIKVGVYVALCLR